MQSFDYNKDNDLLIVQHDNAKSLSALKEIFSNKKVGKVLITDTATQITILRGYFGK